MNRDATRSGAEPIHPASSAFCKWNV